MLSQNRFLLERIDVSIRILCRMVGDGIG